jgi:hypothetical protein
MRLAVLAPFALFPLVAFAACSSSSSATSNGGGTGEGGTGTGSGGDASDNTGGNTGASCEKPTDCTGGDVCCGTIPITGGTAPNCTSGMITSVCQPPSHCITQLGSTCMGTQTVRICTTNADCLEKGANLCCTFSGDDGGSLTFCANGLIAGFGGGKCM